MKRLYKYLILIVILMVGCQKEGDLPVQEGYDKDYIYFFMKELQQEGPFSKAIVEDTETLKTLRLPLYVVDQKSTSSPFDGSVAMAYQDELWPATKTKNGDKVAWEGRDYSFYSWILSEDTGTDAGTVTLGEDAKPADNVTITQPTSYTHSDEVWADFLISYVVNVDGSKKPLVGFEMERITAGVEVYVSTPLHSDITIKQISMDNIVYSGNFSLVRHDLANSGNIGIRNNWVSEIDETKTATYLRTDVAVEKRNTEEIFDPKFRVMRFITVPQNISSTLSITYTSNGTEYSESFVLSEVTSIQRWDRGRKTRYYINLDTSVGLEANVAEWVSVDFIEGTFLPLIPKE